MMPDQNSSPRHRTIVISDETWANTLEQAALEGKTASELCLFLANHYINLEQKPVYALPDGLIPRSRTIYLPDSTWAALKREKVLQNRSSSEIMEQLLRGYLGLSLGNRLDAVENK
ncbi:MAG: ribbon-helix-helix protein, CopG family [Anaerolineae bacterium]|nr:ribbon-helix-helix protein, CopG family [Anaerolineae bacterium]